MNNRCLFLFFVHIISYYFAKLLLERVQTTTNFSDSCFQPLYVIDQLLQVYALKKTFQLKLKKSACIGLFSDIYVIAKRTLLAVNHAHFKIVDSKFCSINNISMCSKQVILIKLLEQKIAAKIQSMSVNNFFSVARRPEYFSLAVTNLHNYYQQKKVTTDNLTIYCKRKRNCKAGTSSTHCVQCVL